MLLSMRAETRRRSIGRDGPRARALAASGAFGELGRGPHLRPVFEAVDDAEGARSVLSDQPPPELPRAA